MNQSVLMNEKKWVLVTGAASGIGKAAAELLAQNRFGVYAADISPEIPDAFKREESIRPIRLDITDQVEVDRAFDFISGKGTGLFALVNNAGIFSPGPLMEMDIERLVEQYDVNVFGTHRVTRAFFPLLLSKKGRIVNMSSVAGFVATPFSGSYASSKHALEGWSDALRCELSPLDVKVIVIEPALINTPLWDKDPEGRISKYQGSIFYEANRKKLAAEAEEAKRNGVRPRVVANAVVRALKSPNPKPRYLVTNHPVKHRLVKFLPDVLTDWLVTKEIRGLLKRCRI
ncbi:MAG: SDR family oxidoreductase [Deltaproteobacteria bacterium]|nr:SDR family oxidoreductase [Deltaproteobacteria bacterium]